MPNAEERKGKRLYAARSDGRLISASHSYQALRRRYPDHEIVSVREQARFNGRDGLTVRYEVLGQ